jgi:hypothetical protein
MDEIKPLTPSAIPRALEKAERYRLLNEPGDAESICLDVLALEPGHSGALVTLLLALTDQFDDEVVDAQARAFDILPRLPGEYERAYYAGIICERRAKARLKRGGPGSGYVAHDSLREAMSWFQKAEALRPAGNDDAILRWNACARILERHPHVVPAPREISEPPLE